MSLANPIYTEQGHCRDCYKCVRHCPVKAIRFERSQASIIPDHCIYCGMCVELCPVEAKRVRDDLNRAKLLVRRNAKVIASLDASFVTEFPGIRPGQLIRALKELGFYAVSEAALGAEEITAHCMELVRTSENRLWISAECPSVVELIRKHYAHLLPHLTPVLSSMTAHARLLQQHFGKDIGIVHLTPCIARKLEADDTSQQVDVALTFTLLRQWFEDRGLVLAELEETAEDVFVPHAAQNAPLYAVSGGMLMNLALAGGLEPFQTLAFSGVSPIMATLDGLQPSTSQTPLFLELLACDGGCVNGPRSEKRSKTASKFLDLKSYA